jgi:hypothetical protein
MLVQQHKIDLLLMAKVRNYSALCRPTGNERGQQTLFTALTAVKMKHKNIF